MLNEISELHYLFLSISVGQCSLDSLRHSICSEPCFPQERKKRWRRAVRTLYAQFCQTQAA